MATEYDIWGCANKLKIEAVGEVENSPFENVYRQAERILINIIKNGKKTDEKDGSRRDDQIANVVSFLGARGRGKTSAMYSVYSSVNKLLKKDSHKENETEEIKFYEGPKIDAAMLAENEFVIDVVLAEMWDAFNKFVDEPANVVHEAQYTYLVKDVKTKFVEARKAYLVLKGRERNENEEDLRDLPAASALYELAISLNLKTKMKELVESYIKVMEYKSKSKCTGYLVLAIDDVDMANISAQMVLEQIRRFLSIPQVIIFLTADIERLREVCASYYKKKSMQMKDEELSKFIVDYLEKVLPTNMRIYMPELSECQEEIFIVQNNLENQDAKSGVKSEKEIILELFADKCGIYFDCERGKRSFLQNNSLRSMVNYFDEMIGLKDEENPEEYISWLRKDLQERLAERIEDEEQRSFLRYILKVGYEEINHNVMSFIRNSLGLYQLRVSDESIGQILYACNMLANDKAENINFVNCMIVLYSIIMKQADDKQRKNLVGNSIFGEWEYGIMTGEAQISDFISGFENRAELKFEITEEIEGFIKNKNLQEAMEKLLGEHDNEIKSWMLAMLFVNIKIPSSKVISFEAYGEGPFFEPPKELLSDDGDSQSQGNEPDKAKSYFNLQPQLRAYKSYFKFLYTEVTEQEETLRLLLQCGIKALADEVASYMGIEASAYLSDTYIKEKMAWFNSLAPEKCIIPELLQSVEIIYSIGSELESERDAAIGENQNIYKRMAGVYRTIMDELRTRDQYYSEHIGNSVPFMGAVEKSLQARIFFDEVEMSEDLKKEFKDRFIKLFRTVSQPRRKPS